MKHLTDYQISLLDPSEVDWYFTSKVFYSPSKRRNVKIKRGHIKGSNKQEVMQIIPS